jgi:hypothetical protein
MLITCHSIGIVLILAALFDVFQTLFHPLGAGAMSDRISCRIWKIFRRAAFPRYVTYVGPVIFVVILVSWFLCIVLGFAFIYWPHMAPDFVLAPGLNASEHRDFLDALNVSLGALVTLSGDFIPRTKFLRLLMGLEGVLGFGLLTASVSWLLSIYPVLELRRSFAQKVVLLRESHRKTGVGPLDLGAAQRFQMLFDAATEITRLRNTLAQFPVSYYFHPGENESSLPAIMDYLSELSHGATDSADPSAKLAGTLLKNSLRDYLALVADDFLHLRVSDVMEIRHAYVEDQMAKGLQRF